MATRLKTIEYTFPVLDTATDNTLTAMTQITAYIPEFASTVTFKSVIFTASWKEGAAQTTGNYPSRRLDVSVGGASATSYTNASLYTGSGENTQIFHTVDATSHFATNWTTGTSKTLDCSVLIDGTAVTINWVDIEVTCYITYEYDDTVTTQIKTVYIPLNCPIGTLGTGTDTNCGTIPNLDTLLPEASKTYRDLFIVFQGNIVATGSTADRTYAFKYDTTTIRTSQSIEMGAASDYWARFIIKGLGTIPTNASSTFNVNTTGGRTNHPQAYLVVTYEFNASTTTDIFISTMLPMELTSPMGRSVTEYQRGTRDLWIQEDNITTQHLAFYLFWSQATPMSDLYMRIGTGSFVQYIDTASILGGSNGAMAMNNSAFTLQRGKNTLNFDCYTPDVIDMGFNLSGFWIVNYIADKPTQGCGAANHTVKYNLCTTNAATASSRIITPTPIDFPETSYFLNALGTNLQYITNSTGNAAGVTVLFEKTSAEGGIEWLPAYLDIAHDDPETGLRQTWSQIRSYFERWEGDVDLERLHLETTRKWRIVFGNNTNSFTYLDLYATYHTIDYTVSGTISGSNSGTVNIDLYREEDGQKLLTTSRVGDGAYSFTWYDNTKDVFVKAYEDATYKGISKEGTPATNFDIALSGGAAPSVEYFF